MRASPSSPVTLATAFATFGLASVAGAGEQATASTDGADAVIRECLSEYREAVDEGKPWDELKALRGRLLPRLENALSEAGDLHFDKAKHTEVVFLYLRWVFYRDRGVGDLPTLRKLRLESGIYTCRFGLVASLSWKVAEYHDFDLERIDRDYVKYYGELPLPLVLVADLDGDERVELVLGLQVCNRGAFIIVDMTPQGLVSLQHKPKGLPDYMEFAFDEETSEIVQSFRSRRRFQGYRQEGERWVPFFKESRIEARFRYVDGEVVTTKTKRDVRTYAEPAPPESGGG